MAIEVKTKLEVVVLREGDAFIAYSPALDLSTCGQTFEEAQQNFNEALDIFLVECIKDDTLGEVLESLGWKKVDSKWQPPTVVGQIDVPIAVPA